MKKSHATETVTDSTPATYQDVLNAPPHMVAEVIDGTLYTNLWFVDPRERSLEAFQLLGAKWVLIDKLFDNASVSLPPFEAICFDLDDLWPPPTVHKALPESVPEPMVAAK